MKKPGLVIEVAVAVVLLAGISPAADFVLSVGQQQVVNIPGLDANASVGVSGPISASSMGPGKLNLYGSGVGAGSLTVQTSSGVRTYTVQVFATSANPADLKRQLEELLRDIDGLQFRIAGGRVVAEGTIQSQQDKLLFDNTMEMFPEVINMVRAKEVLIDIAVTLVEVEATTGVSFGLLDVDSLAGLKIDGKVPITPSGASQVSMQLALTSEILKVVSASVSSGRARILAQPRVVAINRNEASISAGGEIPYEASNGIGGTTVQYKSYGIKLQVKPELRPTNEIVMDMHLESSEPVGIVTKNNPLTSRSADMKVAVEKGKSLIVAGLFSTVTSASSRFGCIFPLLGAGNSTRKREILLLVTPNAPSELDYKDFKLIKPEDAQH
jgi:Flp pilus assembly secretin CpaC